MKLKRKITMAAVFTVYFLIAWTTGAFAWCGYEGSKMKRDKNLSYADVHYSDTKQWAMEVGFNTDEAEVIARACNDVDMSREFFNKKLHLGTGFTFGSTFKTADRADPRIRAADDYLARAKSAASKITGTGSSEAAQRKMALTYLGKGLHSLQDFYAHMNAAGAGDPKYGSNPLDLFTHGEGNKVVDVVVNTTYKNNRPVYQTEKFKLDNLYDATNIDFYPVAGSKHPVWIKRASKSGNQRWVATENATKEYLSEYLKAANSGEVSGDNGFVEKRFLLLGWGIGLAGAALLAGAISLARTALKLCIKGGFHERGENC